MTWEIAFVFGLLLCGVILFVRETFSPDLTAAALLATLLAAAGICQVTGLETSLPPIIGPGGPGGGRPGLLSVFSNPAPLTIAALFIISAALERSGAVAVLSTTLGAAARFGYIPFLAATVLLVAALSAFVNNTPVVIVFLPVVINLAGRVGVPPSKLLIPLSYGAILGGSCTLVGTSTNVLASGILQRSGHSPLGMFELAAAGVPLLLAALAYLCLVGHRLLPARETLTSILSEEERREYIAEAFVFPGSPAAGRAFAQTNLAGLRGVRAVEVIRDGVALAGDPEQAVLEVGDRLVLACNAAAIARANEIEGFDLTSQIGLGLKTIAAHEATVVEGVIGPDSPAAGGTIRNLRFRQRYRLIPLAIHRKGVNLRQPITDVPLEPGDTLLLAGTPEAVEALRLSGEISLLDRPPPPPSASDRRRMPLVAGTLAAVVAIAALTPVPIAAAAIVGATVLLLCGCLSPREAYASIDWGILLLIFGMLGVGLAFESTGAAAHLADILTGRLAGGVPPDLQPIVLLAVLYLATSLLTECLSNNATVVIAIPIALSLGDAIGADPRPFAIVACLASSLSFSTPIGYQTNTYVYGVGGYRFTDFCRVGLPLNLLCATASLLLVPAIWPFFPPA